MKGLDTNVLLRYVTEDDPKQAAVAAREIEGAASRGEKVLVQPLVLCELEWVLDTSYRLTRPEIAAALERILQTAQFEIADRDTVWRALSDYRRGRGDFSDYYLGHANTCAGAPKTLTFDKALKDDAHFTLLEG